MCPFRHSRENGNPVLHFLYPAMTNLDARFRGHDNRLLRLNGGISTIPEEEINT
jgi:hypothetical protein